MRAMTSAWNARFVKRESSPPILKTYLKMVMEATTEHNVAVVKCGKGRQWQMAAERNLEWPSEYKHAVTMGKRTERHMTKSLWIETLGDILLMTRGDGGG